PYYNDHPLINRKPERDLHIKPDWLLIYKYDGEFVRFIDTGSHADLFK
ncbi:MAG TPA: type II toxin-antitoxin system YafQ family toxin, partial [Candidatus Limosilactobacillus intestinavium]|nr:type II toxin-antitoxin system YafQ family toxin [Candidatus Limosilactobacillus intestinavium]